MLGVAEQATVTADPGVVCAGVVAVGAGLPTPPVRTGHAAGRLAAGYLGVLRAAARRTTGHPVGGSCATDAKHRRFTDPVFEQNPYSFAVRAAAIDVAVGIQDHPTSRRTIAARASHFRSHRRHRQRAQPDQRRALPADPELWLEAAALNNETWWQDWTRCVADREEVPQTSRSRELELAGSRGVHPVLSVGTILRLHHATAFSIAADERKGHEYRVSDRCNSGHAP